MHEDRAQGGGHHVLGALRNAGQGVARPVDPAALPTGARQHLFDGLGQPGVGVGDDQAHPAQTPGPQRAEELGPEHLVLAVADRQPSTSRPPVAATPVATTTALDTIWWQTVSRALT